jgi:hypothetical protein
MAINVKYKLKSAAAVVLLISKLCYKVIFEQLCRWVFILPQALRSKFWLCAEKDHQWKELWCEWAVGSRCQF